MTYQLTIQQKAGYLHAIVTGQNSKENVERYLEEILRDCQARNCFKVLIEERLEGPRLRILDVFEIVSQGTLQARGTLQSVAYVDVHAEGDLMNFAENVATNRAFPMKVFSNLADAEKWLMR
jgi:hypothetical protein